MRPWPREGVWPANAGTVLGYTMRFRLLTRGHSGTSDMWALLRAPTGSYRFPGSPWMGFLRTVRIPLRWRVTPPAHSAPVWLRASVRVCQGRHAGVFGVLGSCGVPGSLGVPWGCWDVCFFWFCLVVSGDLGGHSFVYFGSLRDPKWLPNSCDETPVFFSKTI